MISVVAVFCFVMGVYETLEYLLCYDDEKREQEQETALARLHYVTQSNTVAQYSAIPGSSSSAVSAVESSTVSDSTSAVTARLGSVISGLSSALSGNSARSAGYMSLQQSDHLKENHDDIQMEALSLNRSGYESLDGAAEQTNADCHSTRADRRSCDVIGSSSRPDDADCDEIDTAEFS